MQKIKIWHNVKCSKSRIALELLENNNCDIEVISYVENTPSIEEIKNIINNIGINARDLMRVEETLYSDLNLSNESLSEDELISVMHDNPCLIQRPIVIKDGKAVLGRPLEKVIELIS